jgi:hypothetical protein
MLLNDEIKCFQEMETRRKTRTVASMFSSYRRYSHPVNKELLISIHEKHVLLDTNRCHFHGNMRDDDETGQGRRKSRVD